MFLGREPTTRLGTDRLCPHQCGDKSSARRAWASISTPETLVSELSIAERQFVEIAHGIKADASIFILDEPTAALNAADVEVLNKHIRRLRDEGKAVVYISHRMDEIFEICDTVTVLKDGKLVGTRPLSEMTPASLIAMMVGRELQDLFPPRGSTPGDVVLDAKDFKIGATTKPFSLTVSKGEIVAIAGLEGQGQQNFSARSSGNSNRSAAPSRSMASCCRFPSPLNPAFASCKRCGSDSSPRIARKRASSCNCRSHTISQSA